MREGGTRKPKSYRSLVILVNDRPTRLRRSSHTEFVAVSSSEISFLVYEPKKIFENNTSY